MLIGYYAPNLRKYYEGYRGLEEPRKPKNKPLLKKEERKKIEVVFVHPIR